MIGKTMGEFMEVLYQNPEMEILFRGKRYLISGFIEENQGYTLRMDSIESQSRELFCVTSTQRYQCVNAFGCAAIFDNKTIYEAEQEIEVLFG